MFKITLLAGAMMLSVPAFAQTASAPTSVDLAGPQSAGASTAGPATTAIPASADPIPAPVAQPAAATQIADVVNVEFPSYDKNGDGALSPAEFDAWMVALKTASDPSTKATSPATKAWLTQAFAQADTDKNKQVSKSELTGFLTQQG